MWKADSQSMIQLYNVLFKFQEKPHGSRPKRNADLIRAMVDASKCY